jgi:hypothetical protein
MTAAAAVAAAALGKRRDLGRHRGHPADSSAISPKVRRSVRATTAAEAQAEPPPIYMPEVLTTPTGWLLLAAGDVLETSLDTGGGVTSDTRVGLGDVAEFGIATTDQVRERDDNGDARSQRIQPYVTASFRLGISESRLFRAQPGFTLGFRKSFERNHGGFTTRIAELTLVASKHAGKHVASTSAARSGCPLEGDLDADMKG